ncbi:Lrp/AsnC ligand binding domain-containing protein, partial [Methanosarcina mazei]
MINVLPGYEKAAYRELRNIEGIKDVYHVFGEYDFVVIIDVKDLSILNAVVDRIRAVSYTHLRAHETRGNLVCR